MPGRGVQDETSDQQEWYTELAEFPFTVSGSTSRFIRFNPSTSREMINVLPDIGIFFPNRLVSS